MQLKTGFLSLLFLMPLAMASPIQSCANELQALQSQVSPADISAMALARPHVNAVGTVFWVRCNGRARKCAAKVEGRRGRHWRATWRLRSYRRRGRFEDVAGFDDDDSELGRRPGLLNIKSIKCDPQRRVCSGRMQRGGAVATWSAVRTTRRGLSLPTEDTFTEGDLDEEVESYNDTEDYDSAQNDDDLLDSDELLSEGVGDDDDDNNYENSDALQEDEDPFRPIGIRNRGLVCNRHRRTCTAKLLRRGFAMKWNIRIE